MSKIAQAGVRRRAELLYQQLDGLQALRRTLRPELLAESRGEVFFLDILFFRRMSEIAIFQQLTIRARPVGN